MQKCQLSQVNITPPTHPFALLWVCILRLWLRTIAAAAAAGGLSALQPEFLFNSEQNLNKSLNLNDIVAGESYAQLGI